MAVHRRLWVPESERQRQQEEDNRKQLVKCDNPAGHAVGRCQECKGKVVWHCKECKQAITGCGCTLKQKVDNLRADATAENLHR